MGLRAGATRGFDVQTLLRLNEFKSPHGLQGFKGSFTALHFVALQLLSRAEEDGNDPREALRVFLGELSDLHGAAGVNLEAVRAGVELLRIELTFLNNELSSHREAYASKEEVAQGLGGEDCSD